MKFTFSSGQRPLDGYTIKRGVGKGGFGDVYYGVSDGGKEVALKLIRSNLDVELRGVAQCLNLKHPNLVNLFDVRTDGQGDHWVVMEYVSGESLNTVLSRHPKGLAPELARQWFLAIASAVGYLHDHGIVHRDLKPGNIFLENGIIKIGDYGLSKFIGGSHHDAQTQSVGTVHYMAPEVGSGNYNKQIDIYAAGIILYEMLTGRVPFDGESPTEILMKHLTSPPDLGRLPREYQALVAKALAKDPAKRYASMAEMARAVEALVDGKRRLAAPPPPALVPVPPVPRRGARALPVLEALPVEVPSEGRVGELCGSLSLAAVLTALAATLWAAVAGAAEWSEMGTLFFLTLGVSWAVLVPGKLWRARARDSWARRLVMLGMGVLVGSATLYVNGWVPRQAPALTVSQQVETPWVQTLVPTGGDLKEACATLSYFAVAFFVLRWWRLTERRRNHRFSFGPVLATGVWSALLLLIWNHGWQAGLALVLSSAIVQLVSPWEQPPPPPGKRLRLRYV